MTPSHHPTGETLLLHASGGLDAAFRAVVAMHLPHCPSCRAAVRAAEQVGGRLLDALPAAGMAGDARDRALARLDAAPPVETPAPPGGVAGYPVGPWRRLGPGIAMATLLPSAPDRAGLHLLRVRPGARLAGHGHEGLELTCVLEGAFRDESGEYGPGDLAENDDGHDHAPVAVGGVPCLCLIAVRGQLRFHHWLLRLLRPLFRL